MEQMEHGKGMITTIFNKKGFGFIRQEDGTDIFFHARGCVDIVFEELREGMEVSYIATADTPTRKPRAVGVVMA